MEPKPKAIIIHYYTSRRIKLRAKLLRMETCCLHFLDLNKDENETKSLCLTLCLSYNREISLSSLSPMCVTLLAFSLYVYDEFYRNSHLKKTQFVAKCVLMSTTAGNIFFVEYGLLEHIFMRERGEKVEIFNFTHGMSLFSSKQFRSFSHSG